jgi:RNA polymerase sigma-70 factor (ECF subfamily)
MMHYRDLISDDLTDEYLVLHAQSGEEDAFTRLFYKYNTLICKHILHLVRNHDEMQDLAQITFYKAFRNIATLKDGSHFKSWLYQIATNTARDHLRTEQRRPWLSNTSPLPEVDLHKWDMEFEEQVCMAEMFEEALHQTLQKLSHTQRTCLLLHGQGLEIHQIAVQLQLKEAVVKKYTSKAYQVLREIMQNLLDKS